MKTLLTALLFASASKQPFSFSYLFYCLVYIVPLALINCLSSDIEMVTLPSSLR